MAEDVTAAAREACLRLYQLIRLRLDAAISDREVARRWDMSWRSFMNLKEGKRRPPRVEELESLARLLDVDIAVLVAVVTGADPVEVNRSLDTGNADSLAHLVLPSVWQRAVRPGPERHHLKATLSQISAGFFTADLRGTVGDLNGQFAELVDRPMEKVAGRSVLELLEPGAEPEFLEAMARAMRRGMRPTFEVPLVSKRVALFSLSRITNASGSAIGVQGVAQDVTQQRQNALAAEQLAGIVQTSPDAMMSIGLDGLLMQYNAAARRLLELPEEGAERLMVADLVPPDKREELRQMDQRLRRGELIYEVETTRTTRSGRTLEVSLSASPVRDASGKVRYYASTMRDISRRKHSIERYRALIEATPDMIFVCGADHRLLEFVPAAGQRPYVSPEEFLGKRFIEVLPPRVGRMLEAAIDKAAVCGQTVTVSYELPTRASTHLYECRIVPVAAAREFVAVVRDMTLSPTEHRPSRRPRR